MRLAGQPYTRSRKSGQRVAFLAGLALLKTNPAEAYRLAAWADDEMLL
ncbi:putative stability/partitioning protein [Escherichia coli]|uniref:Putative stability/partitioning protein n=1 Tax=Escherichia coli TaxID=562 RepID=A0A376U5Y7_ECOLX|nr:putative stability/partitioning protein [Escherichia coli]